MTHRFCELSCVIPVYNSEGPLQGVVEDLTRVLAGIQYEIILVNDGSADGSAKVCRHLVAKSEGRIKYLELSRNFGEHSAVLCGLSHSRGAYVAVLDDDGQNPPDQVKRLYTEIKRRSLDTLYGYYESKQHSWFRNLGSSFNDRIANLMLKKPKHIYLSSFKVMSRFTVDEVIKYKGPFPYIDGLIFRATGNIDQIPVQHKPRLDGRSGYTLKKLIALWLNMFLNFSIMPLRAAVCLGFLTAFFSVILIGLIIIDKFVTPGVPMGVPSILVTITFFAGVQLMVIGMVGEYLGRLYMDQSGLPQYVVRWQDGFDVMPGSSEHPGVAAHVRSSKRGDDSWETHLKT